MRVWAAGSSYEGLESTDPSRKCRDITRRVHSVTGVCTLVPASPINRRSNRQEARSQGQRLRGFQGVCASSRRTSPPQWLPLRVATVSKPGPDVIGDGQELMSSEERSVKKRLKKFPLPKQAWQGDKDEKVAPIPRPASLGHRSHSGAPPLAHGSP
ncbi:unnamed protein product [Pleuronectes platessa]|uniref:Uncharacterized protein n=1 Tax=Pleuronectes platessa TaxID=8262 RepID=A0A9N7TUL9_PLEPL|nr:unnamed protein product [Pleuronectes platessa]